MESATIMNIQKYSVHDGPGIRTTVFLKGCPLNCWWCHNPESQKSVPEVLYYKNKCSHCGICEKRCDNNCIEIKDNTIITTTENCTGCEKCLDYCVNNARELKGQTMTTEELLREVEKDKVFYDESNGGVTFSGGEPLMHAKFLFEALKMCKEKEIHTTIDTSGFSSWENIEMIAPYVDLFLFDIKHMDSDAHKKYTGVGNEIILENLKKLNNITSNIYIRLPIIPTINDDENNIQKLIEFISTLRIKKVNLLPYHKIGMDKYERINMEYKMPEINEPSQEYMNGLKKSFECLNIDIKIGG